MSIGNEVSSVTPKLILQLLEERYGSASPVPEVAPVANLFLNHRSVRKFLDNPLASGTLEALVAAAQSASTSSNLQAWSVVSVEDPTRKAELAALASNQQQIHDAPVQLVWVADLARLYDAAATQDIDAQGVDYLELFLVAVIDAAIAAQSAALAAESMGLGIVYIGAMRNKPEAVAKLLGLPKRCFAVFGMCIGHPDPKQPSLIKPRLAQPAVWHREQYNTQVIPAAIEAYDDASLKFYRSQNMNNKQWSIHSGKRIVGPSSLNGRHELAEALIRLGFPLK